MINKSSNPFSRPVFPCVVSVAILKLLQVYCRIKQTVNGLMLLGVGVLTEEDGEHKELCGVEMVLNISV